MSPRPYRLIVNGAAFRVEVGDLSASPISVVVDGVAYEVEVRDSRVAASRPARRQLAAASNASAAAASGPARADASPAAGDNVIAALMPGRVVSVAIAPGDAVREGQVVCVIESMKMEQNIVSPRDGTVGRVLVRAGESVGHGQSLIEFE